MDDPLQARAYAEADFSCGDEALIQRLQEYLISLCKIPSPGSMIVDLGCGPGNICERLQRLWPEVMVLGIDGAQAMLDHALQRQKAMAAELKRLTYRCSNLSSLVNQCVDLKCSAALVVSNSLLHHLHDPNLLWQVTKYLAAPGAFVFHRDLRRPLSTKHALSLIHI